jgi:RNA polymerase sigma factor (sigma-70 family)
MSSIRSAGAAGIAVAYYEELRRHVRRRVRDESSVEDLVQDVCVRLAGVDLRKVDSPKAFLFRMATNLVIDHRRRQRVRDQTVIEIDPEFEGVDDNPDAERRLAAKQRLELLKRAVDELPPRCRECFVLRRFDNLEPDEIARRMGVSRNMVEKHLRFAVAHCAERLRELN